MDVDGTAAAGGEAKELDVSGLSVGSVEGEVYLVIVAVQFLLDKKCVEAAFEVSSSLLAYCEQQNRRSLDALQSTVWFYHSLICERMVRPAPACPHSTHTQTHAERASHPPAPIYTTPSVLFAPARSLAPSAPQLLEDGATCIRSRTCIGGCSGHVALDPAAAARRAPHVRPQPRRAGAGDVSEPAAAELPDPVEDGRRRAELGGAGGQAALPDDVPRLGLQQPGPSSFLPARTLMIGPA
jgi:hypothetical protein